MGNQGFDKKYIILNTLYSLGIFILAAPILTVLGIYLALYQGIGFGGVLFYFGWVIALFMSFLFALMRFRFSKGSIIGIIIVFSIAWMLVQSGTIKFG